MAITLKNDQGSTFSTAAAFGDGTQRAEFWGVDDSSTPTAMEAIWVQLTHSSGATVAPILVPAGQTYIKEFSRGQADNWTWQVAAAASTTDILIVED